MDHKKPGILSYIIKTVLLFLYFSFFIVQLFFVCGNTNSDASNTFPLLTGNGTALHHATPILKKTDRQKDKTQSIRLNKRFEPGAMPVCYWVDVKSPVYHLETKRFVSSYRAFIPSSILYPQSFRGPPNVG